MNKRRFIIPAIVVLVLSGLFAVAGNYHWFGGIKNSSPTNLPDAKEELKKLYLLYNRPDSSFNMEGTIRLFDRENKDAFKEETRFACYKQGKQYYSQLGYLQTFLSDTLVVQLDTVSKYITVSKISSSIRPEAMQTVLPFEKYMEDTSTFKIEATVSEKDNERSLLIKSDLTPGIKSYTVFYDPKTYRVKRIETEWWKQTATNDKEDDKNKSWLTVMEYNYPITSGLPVGERIKKIIVKDHDKIVPGQDYKEYKIRLTF
jgi:hypothetical protein